MQVATEILLLLEYGIPVILDHDVVLVDHVHTKHHVGSRYFAIVVYFWD